MTKQTQFLVALFVMGLSGILRAQGVVTIEVMDATSGEPVSFATWQLEGTTRAGLTDLDGVLEFSGYRTGTYELAISSLGYETLIRELDLVAGQDLMLTLELGNSSVQLDEVVVSAQLDGQRAAIQRQVNADQIVSVVSKDRIEEVPDQNAAETVGRIAGVSLQRDGGEATKVSIRGLSPRYNSITINGERIPATDAEDRSVDLSMVSTDALDGIEVYKSITPDQDGDAVGGTVNFLIKKARQGFRANVKASNTYNAQQSDFALPRASFSVSDRVARKKLGLVLTGNYQRANRSSDVLTAQYATQGEDAEGRPIIINENLNLADRLETRERYGGSLSADYDLGRGSLVFSSFLGATDRDETRYRTRLRNGTGRKEYELRQRVRNQLTWNNNLNGEHRLGSQDSELSYGLSYARTTNETPRNQTARFRENGAFVGQIDETDINSILRGTRNDLDATFFQQDRIDEIDILTEKYTGRLDYKRPFRRGKLSGYLKFGGKFRRQTRSRDSRRDWSGFGAIGAIQMANPDAFQTNDDDRTTISQFLGDHDPGEFLNGQLGVPFGPTLDIDAVNAFTNRFAADFYSEDERLRLQNYESAEEVTAAYVMTKLTFGERLTIIPGVRMEHTATNFEGLFGRSFENDGQVFISARDTVGENDYTEFLPMVQAKYQVKPWMDIRAAATRTLARPNFYDLVPFQQIDDINRIVTRGNPELLHTKAWNYDLGFSFYNDWGLISLGGFHKVLDDVDFLRISRDTEAGSGTRGYQLVSRDNLPAEVRVLGAEFDVQANLTFLPKPWSNIVVNFNYTLIESETLFPQLKIVPGEAPFFIPTPVDTFRNGVLPDQPRSVMNASLGYEVGGFTGRVSVVRQGETLFFVGGRAELDGLNRTFARYDLALKQKLTDAFSLFVNVNNLSNTPEFTFLAANQSFPLEEEYFGLTADIGFKYKF